ncbi:hypothetical protein [Halalkalibacillus halophilus]|uniref:hypothetical protein n=1 Tax=Halalkalibacillus halophilus TaxID=392827 RepID=UPI0004158464|nr:hypothetical protein [Halalkalibacillus halophilus]
MDALITRFLQSLHLSEDYFEHVNERSLELKIPNAPSNTIGEQAYCIIGARESYLNALKAGEWIGFECSLTNSNDKNSIIALLNETHRNIEDFLQANNLNEINVNLLMDLYEHEIQHHGQLIRYTYANKIDFPKNWNTRYTV